jgi:transcriptional regulator with XRE-family HTH domain
MNIAEGKFLRELGRRVRGRREGRGWTQAELARRCELHRTFVGSVERGERNISILNLRRIAEVLRVPLAELLAAGPPRRRGEDGVG